jgi:hypothetical protein
MYKYLTDKIKDLSCKVKELQEEVNSLVVGEVNCETLDCSLSDFTNDIIQTTINPVVPSNITGSINLVNGTFDLMAPSGSSGTAFEWYPSNKLIYTLANFNALNVVTENAPGNYSVTLTGSQKIQSFRVNLNLNGENQNAASGAFTIRFTNTNTAVPTSVGVVGIIPSTGQQSYPASVIASSNNVIVTESGADIIVTINGLPGAFPNGSILEIYNLYK